MKYDIYDHGHYLCTINQTLRVTNSAFDCDRCLNAMQTLIDQHPRNLMIMPAGKHKKSDLVSLHEVAPKIVPKRAIKTRSNSKGKGSHFLKKSPPAINRLQGKKTGFSANPKSEQGAK